VKDSFQCLDLHEQDFTPLFDAEWISATPQAPGVRAASRKLEWRPVNNEPALLDWELSWSDEPAASRTRIFMPRLLSDPDVRFVFAADRGARIGGGVLNRGGGVVGISNVFASAADFGAIWDGLADYARSSFPGLPIVAYDHREQTLSAAYRVGFMPVGRLRVWRKAPTVRG
jgi:hypothetical protein